MKFSSKVQKCQLSPVRQFNPCAAEAEAKGRTIYHLNIGQPDIKTPDAFFEAVRNFKKPVLEYAPTPGLNIWMPSAAITQRSASSWTGATFW